MLTNTCRSPSVDVSRQGKPCYNPVMLCTHNPDRRLMGPHYKGESLARYYTILQKGGSLDERRGTREERVGTLSDNVWVNSGKGEGKAGDEIWK